MFRKTETDLAALAATAGRYKTVTTPWLAKQLDALLADIRSEKDRRNARRRELRAIRRAERAAPVASNVVAFPSSVAA